MTSQKLSPADRKEARGTINGHFESMLAIDVNEKELAARILKESKVKFKADLSKIAAAKNRVRELEKQLEKKLPNGIKTRDGKLSIEYRCEYQIVRQHVLAVEKKNKPIVVKRKKALAKLQTTETREDLAKIYKSLGIL